MLVSVNVFLKERNEKAAHYAGSFEEEKVMGKRVV